MQLRGSRGQAKGLKIEVSHCVVPEGKKPRNCVAAQFKRSRLRLNA